MTTQRIVSTTPTTPPQTRKMSLLRGLVLFDGLYELVLGVGLALGSSVLADWFGFGAGLFIVGGVLLSLYGVEMVYMTQRKAGMPRFFAPMVAGLNLAWTGISAVLLALAWNDFSVEARWLLILVADSTLILGALQVWALRRQR